MKAKELIGKLATRTAPVTYTTGVKDSSYMGDVLKILNADDELIAYEHTDGISQGKIHTFGACWCDDNWKPIDDFMEIAKENQATKESER